ncbi:hypothetical protein ACC684_28315 [Rhizobium ruizarguesonis]
MAKKPGRPRNKVDPDSEQVTIQLPSAVVTLMEGAMAAHNIRYRGTFIRKLIESHGTLLPALEKKTSELDEMREMHRETKAMLRVIQTTQADLMRALDVEPTEEPSTDFVDEITSEGIFADEDESAKPARPSW